MPLPITGLSGSGRANRRAYVSLPRKYRPLMKLNRSPSGAPSADRSLAASANEAFGDITCLARVPPQLAGDSRNTRFAGTEDTKGTEDTEALRKRAGAR